MGRRGGRHGDCGRSSLHCVFWQLRGRLTATPLKLAVGEAQVSGLWLEPAAASSCFVFAHGAGAGMAHSFMNAFANGLAERGIATLRYQFPYMERRTGRPDPPAVCQATVRAAVQAAAQRAPGLKLIAGGKSFGGRMTSQAQASHALQGVRGLAFLGFPLHAAGKPSISRGAHLAQVDLPMLFLQGEKDKLAEAVLLRPIVAKLAERARLVWAPQADHGFHVLKRSGRTDGEILSLLLDAFAAWEAEIQEVTP